MNKVVVLIRVFTLIAIVLAGRTASAEIIVGPYLQKVDIDRITVMWETDTAGESWVDYGPDEMFGFTAGTSTPVTIHEVEITGLSAGSEYHYQVRTGPDTSTAAIFATAPVKGSSNFRFLAYGDSRSNEWVHTQVALAMNNAAERTFVLNSGDIVPSSSSGKEYFREDFFGPLEDLIRETPIFVARGNHETSNPHFAEYLAHPEQSSGSENYFSFDYGNVHVIVLNTTETYSAGSAQYTWLESDLAAASRDLLIDWIVVAFHHPPYSTGSHGSNLVVRAALCPLFETYGVDLVFNGHDHDYERIEQRNGPVYIVTGGGGADLRNQGNPKSWSVVYHKLNNFVSVDVTENTLTVIAHGVRYQGHADGDLIDSVVITKDLTWSPTAQAGPDQIVATRTPVRLDGSGSYDGEGDDFAYIWSQVAGRSVRLSNVRAVQPEFTPPGPGRYTFRLVCTERGRLESVPDTVVVGVYDPFSGGEVAVAPDADTYIDSEFPSQNFGSSTELLVDWRSPWAATYLRFEVPPGKGEILAVRLRLYCFNSSDYGGYVRTFSDIHWDEFAPTHDNPLLVDGPVVGNFGSVSSGNWVEMDITPSLAGERNPPAAVSLALWPHCDNGADYRSRESTKPCQVIVTWSGDYFSTAPGTPGVNPPAASGKVNAGPPPR